MDAAALATFTAFITNNPAASAGKVQAELTRLLTEGKPPTRVLVYARDTNWTRQREPHFIDLPELYKLPQAAITGFLAHTTTNANMMVLQDRTKNRCETVVNCETGEEELRYRSLFTKNVRADDYTIMKWWLGASMETELAKYDLKVVEIPYARKCTFVRTSQGDEIVRWSEELEQ